MAGITFFTRTIQDEPCRVSFIDDGNGGPVTTIFKDANGNVTCSRSISAEDSKDLKMWLR